MRRTSHLSFAVLAVAGLAACGPGGVRGTPPGDAGGAETASGGTGANAGTSAAGGTGAISGMGGTGGGMGGTGGTVTGGGTTTTVPAECATTVTPGPAPLRRLTTFEYSNTMASLLDDTTRPGDSLPPEVAEGRNRFGNDVANQPISSFLAEQYSTEAADIATRATAAPETLAALAPCASTVTADTESACARSFIESFAPRAYRHPLEPAEIEELVTLHQALRANSANFTESLAALIEAILQTPDFLYRLEFGTPDPVNPAVRRPTGHEMAARLSYLFWGTMPDAALETAAQTGELSTPQGVYAQAQRLLADPRARSVVRHFFSYYLPISTITDATRDPVQFPTFSPMIGALMREETQRFLEYEIFEGPGTWSSVLTAPYTFANGTLAEFYGIPGVTGEAFQKVDIDTTKRLGLLTQGSLMTGTTVTNFTNPVRRGVFLLENVMCQHLKPPPDIIADDIMPPDPYSAPTGRERYSIHSKDLLCAGCHAIMDPPGFALENYDAVGLWRDQENGVTIDASGNLAVVGGAFSGPLELVQKIAQSPATYSCLAENWLHYAYGRTLEAGDECNRAEVEVAFAQSNYNVQSLLLSLTQTDAFLYLPQDQL